MIEYCEAKRFLASLPWPDGTRPLLEFGTTGQGYPAVRLYRPEPRFRGAAQAWGPTHEGALRFALERWIQEVGVNNDPRFWDGLRRLLN